MLHRSLGSTKLEVSAVGFGAAALGEDFGRMTDGQARLAVWRAVECGINFFDVSSYYGVTLAEQRLGDALEGRRDEVVLATKCGRYGISNFDFSVQTITREVESSLLRLKTECRLRLTARRRPT